MTVLYFAQTAKATGCTTEDWPVTLPLSVEEFWQEAIRRHPRLAALRPHCRIASNCQYLTDRQLITPDGEAAIIPPVSGG
jgi:molybdopterin converting factor small subunit